MGGFDAGGSVESAGGGAVWSPLRKIIWRPISCGLCVYTFTVPACKAGFIILYLIHLILS